MAGAGRLTTHVLDTASGRPAAGLRIELARVEDDGSSRRPLKTATTNEDGRCDAPLLEGAELQPGVYELVFRVGDHFRAAGLDLPEPPFLDTVPIRFGIAAGDQHYHVPLLISPYAYSTYRGS
jgi:5-hydroxyisourate hydrolase